MISPTVNELKKYKAGSIVPVYKDIMADLETPVSVYLKLVGNNQDAILLESVELGEQLGRYSFICLHPNQILSSDGRKTTLNGSKKPLSDSDILSVIEPDLKQKRKHFQRSKNLPAFQGGYVGYLSYENVRHFESIKLNPKKKGLGIPESVLFWIDTFVIFDHIKKKIRLVKLVECGKNINKEYNAAIKEFNLIELKLESKIKKSKVKKKKSSDKLKSNVTKQKFTQNVNKIKNYIKAGDCIQVVCSQRFDIGPIQDEFNVYRVLRSLNPSPYMFYFQHKNLKLVGSSPELLVKKMGNKAEVRPIAGTRPRGKDSKEDKKLEHDLKRSTKELAEHLMLVDLGRNDLGRVSKTKSVEIDNYARVERYSHVMHLVTDVKSTLNSGYNDIDLLRATFPAGTVSGAPKIRAMEIIDEVENEKRGPYAGAVGYFSLTGDMDMCIGIRTVVVKNKHAYVQAGAGIVYDSNPAKEYQESINKAKALIHAVHLAEGEDI